MKSNIVTMTDSYKLTHHNMYPAGTQVVYSYFEARDGARFPSTVFFGLQYILKEYLKGVVVTKDSIDKAEELAAIHFGNPNIFKRERWDYILKKYNGVLPIRIMAVPEGTVVNNSNVLMTVENTDDNCYWLTNHLETLLSHVWASCTVATLSYYTKKLFKRFLTKTSDNISGINFMLHDFGMRGVSSMESAGIEGAGHLINFMGTDTVISMEYAKEYYDANLNTLAFSVPATEHSIMTALGKDGEVEIIGDLLNTYPTGILSVVSDSYNIYDCIKNIYGTKFKHRILARNGKFVVRPDSGEPIEVILKSLDILYECFAGTVNTKGYKVLNPKVGLLWGDGLDYNKIKEILEVMDDEGWSTENIVFGMGGGLLQKINRDTQRFAFKCSAQKRNNTWYNINKEPLDETKVSKKGILKLIKSGCSYNTISNDIDNKTKNELNVVFENGAIIKNITFDEIRDNIISNDIDNKTKN